MHLGNFKKKKKKREINLLSDSFSSIHVLVTTMVTRTNEKGNLAGTQTTIDIWTRVLILSYPNQKHIHFGFRYIRQILDGAIFFPAATDRLGFIQHAQKLV